MSAAFGDRDEDRVHLLTQLLQEPGWKARYDAIRPVQALIEGWRGSYQELVLLIGEQLMDPQPHGRRIARGRVLFCTCLSSGGNSCCSPAQPSPGPGWQGARAHG